MNDKFLSLLGIAKRAGRLAFGHDAVKDAVSGGKAQLLIFSSDSSERLRDEFSKKLQNSEKTVIYTDYTMADIHFATGSKAAVICVLDSGFSERLKELYEKKYKEV